MTVMCLAMGAVVLGGSLGGGWKTFADIPKAGIGMTTVVLNGRIHVVGGSEFNVHQVYDPASDSWTMKAPLPVSENVGWGMAAVYGGRIYFFGGGYGSQFRGENKAWVYEAASDKWSPLAPMPMRRMQGAAVTAGNTIYIFGGHPGTQKISREEEIKTTYRYDPVKNGYTQVADMPESGLFIVSAYYKGNIYAVPGIERTVRNPTDAGQGYVWADGLMKYSPAKNVWTKLNVRRPQRATWMITQQSSNVAIGPRLYLGGGGVPPDRRRTSFAFYFDMDGEKFVELAPLPRIRCSSGGGVVNGKLYIVGGVQESTGEPCAETWGYPFPE